MFISLLPPLPQRFMHSSNTKLTRLRNFLCWNLWGMLSSNPTCHILHYFSAAVSDSDPVIGMRSCEFLTTSEVWIVSSRIVFHSPTPKSSPKFPSWMLILFWHQSLLHRKILTVRLTYPFYLFQIFWCIFRCLRLWYSWLWADIDVASHCSCP